MEKKKKEKKNIIIVCKYNTYEFKMESNTNPTISISAGIKHKDRSPSKIHKYESVGVSLGS